MHCDTAFTPEEYAKKWQETSLDEHKYLAPCWVNTTWQMVQLRWIIYCSGQQFPVQGQMGTISGLVDHRVSVTTTQPCGCSTNAVTDNTNMKSLAVV